MHAVRWALALLLAAFFAYFGVQKFIANPNPIFSLIAERSGIALFEPTVRMLTGAAELIAAVLLAIPATRRLGALLGLAILLGAIGFHFSPWLGIDVPGIGTSLFAMAVGGLVLTVAVLTLESRAGRPDPYRDRTVGESRSR